jgi:hypothetical protein
MCVCALYALTEVRIWGNRALVRRNTYQESATWYGLQVAKLTVPLSYNFLTLTDKPVWSETGFHRFLGRLIDLSPLGKAFSAFFPIFILVPVFATAFGLYGKVRNICGFGDLLEDEDDEAAYAGTGSWREGRALIEREIQGSSGNVLGLSSRNGASTSPPGERYTDSPAASAGEPSSIADTVSNAPTPRTRPERRRPVVDDDDDTGNFFENFANRVKNTFDGTDFTITRPAWMGGDDEVAYGQRARGTDSGNGFLSLFGGRAEEGRVRL